jgi:hypothetical protein
MDKIQIGYWHGSKLEGLDWEQYTILDYSVQLRNDIIDKCLSESYSVSLRRRDFIIDGKLCDSLMIWIANGNFSQR